MYMYIYIYGFMYMSVYVIYVRIQIYELYGSQTTFEMHINKVIMNILSGVHQ